MIKEIIKNESSHFKKYLITEISYIVVDVFTLVIVNALLGQLFPEDSNFRNLLLFMTALLLNMVLYLQAQKTSIRLIQDVIVNIRWEIIEKVKSAELLSFENLGRSQIYNVITLDVQTLSNAAYIMRWMCDGALLCIGLLTYQFIVYKPAFLFTFGILLFGTLVYAGKIIFAKKWVHLARDKEKELFDGISDLIYGFKELRINDKKNDDFFHKNLKIKSEDNKKFRIKAENSLADSNIITTIMETMAFIPIIFILPSHGNYNIHALAVSITCLLFFPFNTIKETIPYFVKGWISVERIMNIIEEIEKIKIEKTYFKSDKKSCDFKKIKYDNLSFTYSDKEGNPLFSIGNINLSIHPGEIIFITGGNGSGKSTLLKLLTGLYSPLSGIIKIDDLEVSMSDYRFLFSAIFSDFHLFDQLYGLQNIDEKRVKELLTLMELDEKVTFKENSFSTLDLSTGQRKRLALLSAILENKQIYVFDEWASDQAPHFRNYFYNNLLPTLKKENKTIIAVTHDDRFFHVADKVLKLDYGQII
ncbi:MAG: cyclic peptide export ABC transporter [Desulfobacterales bacterium]|nr:cyclic peptide export ABC transporter [Desulfobacterales bacterium]